MTQFLENYFNIIALFLTIFTSAIFVTFLIMVNSLKNNLNLNVLSLAIITIYEIIELILLIMVSVNTILRYYSIFLAFSLAMLFYIELSYLFKYLKLKKLKEKTN